MDLNDIHRGRRIKNSSNIPQDPIWDLEKIYRNRRGIVEHNSTLGGRRKMWKRFQS